MKKFKNIDWLPSIEDIVDDVFIKHERLEQESVMYQMLNGCFADPLEDIDDEYEKVDLDRIRQLDPELFLEEKIQKFQNNNGNQTPTEEQKNKKKQDYTPGMRKRPFNFPRMSRLNRIQQATCLRALLRLTSNDKKALTEEERTDLEKYMELSDKIKEEQKEFLNFAKLKWNGNVNWNIKCMKFVALKWKAKMDKLFKLSNNEYIEVANIPLSVAEIPALSKDIKVKCISYLKEGSFSDVILPSLTKAYFLNMQTDVLLTNYLPSVAFERQHFKLPVSEDTCCENLVMNNKVDFVISSSGLKCLLNNIDPQYSNLWAIPVVVKSHNGKNVVYIDKKLPPLTATIPQKNAWVYKYILRNHFVKRHWKREINQAEDESEGAENANNKDYSSNPVSDENLPNSHENLNDNASDNETDSTSDNKSNVTYKLFTIGPHESSDCSKLMKDEMKEFHMLVRTKTDGAEIIGNNKVPVMLEPKMEHQLGLGAEAVTLEEGINQWMSLIFRPNTSIARVRIAADTGEIVQIDRPTTMSLSNTIKMLYSIKVEDSLCVLYNILRKLSTLTLGRYILRHVPQHGAFAYVYKRSEECFENIIPTPKESRFNLRESCWNTTFETVTLTSWPLLDTMTTTPALRLLKRMPAMFNPCYTATNTVMNRDKPGRGRPRKNSALLKASTDEQERKNPGRILRRQKRRNLRKQQSGK